MANKKRMDVPHTNASLAYGKVVLFALLFIIFGAAFYHNVEHLRWLDSFYFTVITLATVGYGDIVPKTDPGKIFTIFYVFVGIVIFVVLARIVVTSLAIRVQKANERREEEKK